MLVAHLLRRGDRVVRVREGDLIPVRLLDVPVAETATPCGKLSPDASAICPSATTAGAEASAICGPRERGLRYRQNERATRQNELLQCLSANQQQDEVGG